jgi:molybdopterin synthase catalytic subunit
MFKIVSEPIDPRAVEAAVARPAAGAIVTFHGVVRDHNYGQRITHLEYEAYPEMAEREMARIGAEIAARWPDARVAMIHRVGRLEVGETSVVIAVSSPHRAEAFDACRYALEALKVRVPIWKKEFAESGEYWIEGTHAHSR